MGELRLFAVGIDEVRDLFGANEGTAKAFRLVAATTFPAPTSPQPGLLAKLGPLLRRPPDAPVVRPDRPQEHDVATLLAGRFVTPERLAASWLLIEAWLADRAWGRFDLELTEAGFTDLEFDLARAGMAPQFGLAKLLIKDLGLPLRPAGSLVVGQAKYAHAIASLDAWREVQPRLTGPHRLIADRYLAFLSPFPGYQAEAAARGRPVPDLIALYTHDAG